MTPHKDPTKLSTDNQLRLIMQDIDKIKWEVSGLKVKLKAHDNQFGLVRTEIHSLQKELKYEIREKFDKIMNRIDEFIGRIDDQDKNIAAATFRQEEHETRLSRLEKTVYVGSGA